jgi:hypothetical protein
MVTRIAPWLNFYRQRWFAAAESAIDGASIGRCRNREFDPELTGA